MTQKNDPVEPPVEDDFYDGDTDHNETAADYDAEETNAKEVKE